VTADEAAPAVSVKCRATYDGVSWKIKARSVIVTAREGSLYATLRLMFERSTVSAVVHDGESKVDKL
jgi:hypothetical protein